MHDFGKRKFLSSTLGWGRAVFVRKKHAKNTVFFESDGEKGLKGEKGVPSLFFLLPVFFFHN
jgi:hypothetical protein